MSKKRIIPVTILIVILLAIIPCAAQAQKVVMISNGGMHVLALMDDGTVYSWGSNNYGGLGIGANWSENSRNPYIVPQKALISNVTAISAGFFISLALKSDGTVWAWGHGEEGELGDGSTNLSAKPVLVKGLISVIAVVAGDDGACYALKNDGTVWAWGLNNEGQVGDGTTENRLTPVQVKGLTNIKALGERGNYAIKNDGTVWAWGSNDISDGAYGALGDSSGPGSRPTPFQVKGVNNATQISSGSDHTNYVKNNGTVWAWGCYNRGQLGDGSIQSSIPPLVKPPSVKTQIDNVKKVSDCIALKDDGTVWAWGRLIGDAKPTPVKVNGLDHVVDISTYGSACIVLKDDGSVWGWGLDEGSGIFGNHSIVNSTNPAMNYIVERNPVLIFSGPVKPTPTATVHPNSTTTISTIDSSATGQPGKTGLPIPGMDFDIVLIAALTMATIGAIDNRRKKR